MDPDIGIVLSGIDATNKGFGLERHPITGGNLKYGPPLVGEEKPNSFGQERQA